MQALRRLQGRTVRQHKWKVHECRCSCAKKWPSMACAICIVEETRSRLLCMSVVSRHPHIT